MTRTPPFKKGDRIRLIGMEDFSPVPAGTLGTVDAEPVWLEGAWNVPVSWDNGRTLSMVVPPDSAVRV